VLTDPIHATILEPRELPVLIQDDERPVVLDATFDLSKPPDGEILALAEQPDGKLLLRLLLSVDGFPSRGIARMHPDGTVDRSFNPHRQAGIIGDVRALQVMSDGSIVIAGNFNRVQGYEMPGVTRLLSDGAVDLTFRPWAIPSVACFWPGPDRTIVMAGSYGGAVIGRYLASGAPDPTFTGSSSGAEFGKTFWTIGAQSTGKCAGGVLPHQRHSRTSWSG
jgi:hypothetical protein